MGLALPAGGSSDCTVPAINTETIRQQLSKICSSSAFDAPDRARRFLTYVIEETLQGRAERIKAYSIATEVFRRDASFDAQNDPVVRIEAGRVRRSLERYYLLAGHRDPIVISMPKGGYVPVFTWRTDPPGSPAPAGPQNAAAPDVRHALRRMLQWLLVAALVILLLAALGILFAQRLAIQNTGQIAAAASAPSVPTVLVKPFEDLAGNQESASVASGLTDEVISRMARFRELSVFASDHQTASASIAGNSRVPNFILEGRIRVEDRKLRFSSRLVRRGDGSVVWTESYNVDLATTGTIEAEIDIARRIARSLAQPSGVIFRADAADMIKNRPAGWEAYACTLTFYGYRAAISRQSLENAQSCLIRTVEAYPSYVTARALLAMTHIDALRFRYRLDLPPPPDPAMALSAAELAVQLDPGNLRALQAQMLAYFFTGKIDRALAVGQRGYELNPDDTEFTAEYGVRLALAGYWDRGCGMLYDAIGSDPNPVPPFGTVRAMCAYFRGDYAAAANLVRETSRATSPIGRLLLVAILGQTGQTARARDEIAWLKVNASDFMENYRSEIELRIIRQSDRELLFEGLRKAGLAPPT